MRLFVTLIVTGLVCTGWAQESAAVSKMQANADTDEIEVTVSSSEPYYVGAEKHILCIGDESFSRSRLVDTEDGNELVFLIPVSKYNALQSGDEVYMVYGSAMLEIVRNQEVSKSDLENRYWELGQFNPEMTEE